MRKKGGDFIKTININSVQISYPKELDTAELLAIVDEQKKLCRHKLKQLEIAFGDTKDVLF